MLLCDTHCDTLYALAKRPGQPTDVTPESLSAGGVNLQVMALFTGSRADHARLGALLRAMLGALDGLRAAGLALVDDPAQAREDGRAVMLSIEGGEALHGGLHRVDEWRARGVRMAALTWNFENDLGFPAMGGVKRGLKPYGLAVVRRMQAVGMAADVSHLNERGFYDVLNKTGKPPLASHSCCAALHPHPRNLTDAQLRALFAAGGYVGVNFYPHFLSGRPAVMEDVADHIDHMHQLGGAGMVGFGSDFDGIECKATGLETPADFPALLDLLRARGYGGETLAGIAGKSLLAYFERLR